MKYNVTPAEKSTVKIEITFTPKSLRRQTTRHM